MPRFIFLIYFQFSLIVAFSQAKEKPFVLIKSFIKTNDKTASSTPQDIVEVGNYIYFTANTTTGRELWKSDGTESGTFLLKDIQVGSGSSNPTCLTNINGNLYFTADDGVHGTELWRSDGSAIGTYMVKDIFQGSQTSSIAKLINNSGILYFSADDGVHGNELWKSDGTNLGTLLVKDANPGSSSSIDTNNSKNGIISTNGIIFFFSNIATAGYTMSLWKSDGTASGTIMLKSNILGDFYSEKYLSAYNGVLYFKQDNYDDGSAELWKSDGTINGTMILKKYGQVELNNLTTVNSIVFFTVDDGIHGNELWKTTGTVASTVLIKDIANTIASSDPENLTNINGILYFSANDITNGRELWKSDGTEAGTLMVKNINPSWNNSNPREFTLYKNQIFFIATNGNGNNLWKTDGTDLGTKEILINNSPAFLSTEDNHLLVSNSSSLFFNAKTTIYGNELWKCDTSANSIKQVKDIGISVNSGLSGISRNNCFEFKGKLFFMADDGTSGNELWQSDGTETGTKLFKDFYPGYNGQLSSGTPVINLGIRKNFFASTDYFYFTAIDNIHGEELWRSDGTPSGTIMVKDIYIGTPQYGSPKYSSPTGFNMVNGILYFTADDGVHGRELWRSDGTEAGTSLVKDIYIGTEGSLFFYPKFIVINNVLYFTADDGVHGTELWRSDGTPSGTILVKDINTNASYNQGSGSPNGLIDFNGVLLFSAYTASQGFELWRSDGTSSGTFLVKDISPGSSDGYYAGSIETSASIFNSTFFFDSFADLWRSDGTPSGTFLVKKFKPVGVSGGNISFSLINDSLYVLSSYMGQYVTNGTTIGTTPISKIPINYKSFPSLNKNFYFSAYYDDLGYEPHLRDSSLSKDILINDINNGPSGSYPEFKIAGNLMYAFATTDSLGMGLWVQDNNCITLPTSPAPTAIVTAQPTCTLSTGTITVSSATVGLTFSINGSTYINTTGIFTGVAPGTYSLTAKNAIGCISTVTSITVNSQPTSPSVPIITAGSSTIFCLGEFVKLTSNSTNGNQWYKDGTLITGETGITYTVSVPGAYTDTITNSNGCKSGSLSKLITAYPFPLKPTIAWNGTQFTATTTTIGLNYQWLLSNSSVSGATSSTYKPTAIGSYKIQITDANGCKNVSDSFMLVVTSVNPSIETISENIAKILPNPASTNVMLYFKQKPNKTLTIKLLNLKGQLVKQTNTNSQSTHISLTEIMSGNYIIEVIGRGYNQTQQLLISK